MDRHLAGSGGTASVQTYNSLGILADVDGANAPTFVISDSAGTSAATGSGTRASTGDYSLTIPTSLTTLDLYTVRWTWPNTVFHDTQFETVGSFLFADAELRGFDAELTTGAYPVLRVRDVREQVEERFARACNVSFTKRGRREFLNGDGSSSIFVSERLVQSLVSVKIGGTTVATNLFSVYPHGLIGYTNGAGSFARGNRNVELLYEHGFAQPPGPIVDAGMRYARYLLVAGANKNDERIQGFQTDVGFARVSLARPDNPTGIPDVDEVLRGYNFNGVMA